MSLAGKILPPRLEWAALSDIGRRRRNNEDTWGAFRLAPAAAEALQESTAAVTDQGLLLIVSDGMGGARAGEEASRFCVEQLPRELASHRVPGNDAVETMRAAIVATHEALVKRGDAHEPWRGMGATLTAVWFQPDGNAVLGHVGDSRVYGGPGDDLPQLSEDQNVSSGMVRRGELTPELAARQKFGSLLEQVMGGDGAPVEPQVGRIRAQPGDRFVLCSDGLHGPLRHELQPALQAALAQPSLAAGAAGLIEAANAAGGPDNITVILARLTPTREA